MTEEEVKELLIKTHAIMNGHFLLTSGLHSPHYVEKFNVLQHPRYTQQLCEAMAEKFKDATLFCNRLMWNLSSCSQTVQFACAFMNEAAGSRRRADPVHVLLSVLRYGADYVHAVHL